MNSNAACHCLFFYNCKPRATAINIVATIVVFFFTYYLKRVAYTPCGPLALLLHCPSKRMQMKMLNFMHILMEVTKPWNFTFYNYYPTHPLHLRGVERMGGFFWSNLWLQYLPWLWSLNFCLPHLPFSMWEGGWGIVFWSKSISNTLRFCKWYCYF